MSCVTRKSYVFFLWTPRVLVVLDAVTLASNPAAFPLGHHDLLSVAVVLRFAVVFEVSWAKIDVSLLAFASFECWSDVFAGLLAKLIYHQIDIIWVSHFWVKYKWLSLPENYNFINQAKQFPKNMVMSGIPSEYISSSTGNPCETHHKEYTGPSDISSSSVFVISVIKRDTKDSFCWVGFWDLLYFHGI